MSTNNVYPSNPPPNSVPITSVDGLDIDNSGTSSYRPTAYPLSSSPFSSTANINASPNVNSNGNANVSANVMSRPSTTPNNLSEKIKTALNSFSNSVQNNLLGTNGSGIYKGENGFPTVAIEQQENYPVRDFRSIVLVAIGVIFTVILKSYALSYVWNATMPYLVADRSGPNGQSRFVIRKISWKIALGLLVLCSLLVSRPSF